MVKVETPTVAKTPAVPRRIASATRAAEAILKTLIVDDEGAFVPPIDPYDIAEQMGIDVYLAVMPDKKSGFIEKKTPDDQAKVYINHRHSPVRQRFTLAHELGHYFYETLQGNECFDSLNREDGHANLGTDPKERWANKFAAALLMPGGPLQTLVAQGETLPELASTFDVSEAAMSYRLSNLGLPN
ncbi:ImmA/IrrE family metallo-endopeptidase [Populibacterium corticicola]|uniref:ImmA/IrrE family metallo-endopeptidase n=1 Tax=Populibacterium corticicola TaxID=1812826 RepID=A0ABW5XCD5_9MICO